MKIRILAFLFAFCILVPTKSYAGDNAQLWMGVGMALGGLSSNKPEKQIAGVLIGGVGGHYVGRALDRIEQRDTDARLARGTSHCSGTSQFTIVNGKAVPGAASGACTFEQTLSGIHTVPKVTH